MTNLMEIKDVIVSYKGFDKNMKCRDFQYKIGETFTHEGEVKHCESGFHAYPAPLDTLAHYQPAESLFCIVEQLGKTRHRWGTVASSVITVKSEINLFEMVEHQIKWAKKNPRKYKCKSGKINYSYVANTGKYSVAYNTGKYSVAANAGEHSVSSSDRNLSVAANTGNHSAAMSAGQLSIASNTGIRSIALNAGLKSLAATMGNHSVSLNIGSYSLAFSAGNKSSASNEGDRSIALNTGDYSGSSVEGEQSVAFVDGFSSKAKASSGSWIVIVERGEGGEIVNIKTAKAGVDIEPDTYYKLVNGEFVKCDD